MTSQGETWRLFVAIELPETWLEALGAAQRALAGVFETPWTPRLRWVRPEGKLQTPVAYLICNFSAPVDGRPALLTHDDVTTLFHEFGHGLQLMLTQVDDLGVSGISGVEWDAVEDHQAFRDSDRFPQWRALIGPHFAQPPHVEHFTDL